MTKTDDFPHPSPNHFHLSVNGHPTAPIVGPKSLGLTLIPLSHSTYVNHQQVLLTYSSKYFQNLTTSHQLHCFYYGPSHYCILFLTVSDILPCLLIIYSSAVRAFLLKHESSDQNPVLTSYFTQSQNFTKAHQALEEPVPSIIHLWASPTTFPSLTPLHLGLSAAP